MEKRQIPIIALAVLSISILCMFDFITKPAYAEVSAIDFVYQQTNSELFYMESFQYYVALSRATASSTTMTFIHGATETPEEDASSAGNKITITPMQGGCTNIFTHPETNYNPCSATVGSANCNPATFGSACSAKTGITGTFGGLWCGLTDCFVLFKLTSGSWSSQLLRYNMATEEITGYMNITSTWLIDPYLWGYDESTAGIGGITLFWTKSNDATSLVDIVFTGGTSLMGNVGVFSASICGQNSCAGGSASTRVSDITGCRHCNNSSTTTRIMVSSTQTIASNRMVTIFTDTGAQQCGGTGTSMGVSQSIVGTGKAEYLGNVKNLFVMGTQDEVVTVNPSSCASATQYTYASQGLVNYVKGIAVDFEDSVYYLHHGTSASKSSVTKMNITSFTTSVNFDATIGDTITGWVDGGFTGDQIATASDDNEGLNNDFSTDDWNTLLIADNTAKARIIYPDGFVGVIPDSPSGIDCSLPENANILICRLGGNSTTVGTGQLVGEGIADLACNVVFADCTDDNPQTNGIGLLIFIASIFVIVGMFFYTIGKEAFHMPIFIWIIIIISLSAFFTIAGLIDPIFLVVSIIAIIALAVPKIIGVVRGAGSFGGGSTE